MKNYLKDLSIPQMIFVIIIAIALGFGILCATSALLMVLWNFAVVGAIMVCAPIGFWEAMCLQLAMWFLFSLRHKDTTKKDEQSSFFFCSAPSLAQGAVLSILHNNHQFFLQNFVQYYYLTFSCNYDIILLSRGEGEPKVDK